MLEVLFFVGAVAGEPGFGGAPADRTPPPPAPAPAGDVQREAAECRVQDDDGRWWSCADVMAGAAAPAEPAPPPVDVRPLVEKMSASPLAPKPRRKTRTEEELAAVGLSVDDFPLAALRRDVEVCDVELEELDARGATLQQKVVVEKKRAALVQVLDLVEAAGRQRMAACAARAGVKLEPKTHRMTAGGPVALSRREVEASLPVLDPPGCERWLLVDQALVDRVKRLAELKQLLANGSWDYYRVAERRALEKERAVLEQELANDGAPKVIVPGASGL